MLAIQAITDAEGASDPPKLSAEDRKWGLHVGDVVQIVQGRSQECTYALYSGQGRVIHAWTPSRQNFRVRMDSLRALTASGYEVRTCSSVLDEFFCQLLKATPLEPASTIRRAKSALHVPAASRQSNLSLVLFARYGDTIFELLHSLKEAYRSACDGCQRGKPSHEHSGGPRICQSLLDSPAHLIKRDIGNVHNNRAAASAGPAIKAFLGSSGDFLMSEWLGKLLTDYFRDAYLTSNWYWVAMSPSTNWLSKRWASFASSYSEMSNAFSRVPTASVFLQYDIPEAIFRVRCKAACGLPERLAGDRMECGYGISTR
jgi:hypothetical protein